MRIATAVLTFRLFAVGTAPGQRALLWALCVPGFSTFLSGYNLLYRLQISFSLTDRALLASIYATLRWSSAAAGSAALITGPFGRVLSIASGILIPFMVLVAHLAYRRPPPGFWPAWFLTLVIAIAYAVSVERNSSNVADTDGTLINALVFFALLQAWPQSSVLADLVLAGSVSAGLVKL